MGKWLKGKSGSPSTQFKRGNKANPKGRPPNPFPALIRNKSQNGRLIVKKMWDTFMTTKDENMRHKYGEFLRDTGWGRPVQQIDTIAGDGETAFIPVVYVPAKKRD